MKKLLPILLLIFLAVPILVGAARTEGVWQERLGTYLETAWNEGRNILINGTNKYLNFGTTSGVSGYGFRDNSGTMEFKNDGGAWAEFGSGGGGGGGGGLFTYSAGNDWITPFIASTSNTAAIRASRFIATSTTATSTFANGINLTGGCFAVGGACIEAGGGSGTVTSVAMTVPTGLTISGSPITTSGTLVVGFDTGYFIPTTTRASNWDTAFTNSHSAVTVSDSSEMDFTLTGQDITASLIAGSIDEIKLDTSTNASLDLADSALQTTSIDTSAELRAIVTDETGIGGALVFAQSPTFTGTPVLPSTFTIGANSFIRSGAHNLTFTTTGATDVTLPTSGTLANLTSAMTGTFDGNNFAGGAIGQGDILYGSGAGVIAELAKDTNATRYLSNQGTSNNPSWNQVNLANGVTGTLPAGNGGTGITSLGTGIATWLGTPSSANLASAVTDETGSGALVFGTSPTISSPTFSSFFGTPCTGNNFLQDISDTGTFTCSEATGGGGGGGSLSTTSEKVGAGPVGTVSYSNDDDFMLGGSASTTAKFLFDFASSTLEIRGNDAGTSTWLSTGSEEALRIGLGERNSDESYEITEGFEFDFGTAGDVIIRLLSSVADWVWETGTNIKLGAVQWNSGDNIDGAAIANGSIDEVKLDTSTNASLDLADSALQNVVEDTTPTLGGNLAGGGFNITDLGDVTFKTGATGGTLRTGTSNADKFTLQAYDVNDTTYRTLIEADAGNTVRLQVMGDFLEIEDNTDPTKQVTWDISGAITGTLTDLVFVQSANRTLTFPDATDTLVGRATTDTLTNKTLTSPTLTSFFGTPCTGNEFLQDISDTGAFSCVEAAGGGTFSWDATSYGVSTSTIVGFTNGMMSMGSSTFTGASTTITNLVAQGAIQFFTQFWNDIADFVTYIRSLFTAGDGIDIVAGAISLDVTDTNINATSTLSLSAGGGIGTITGGATGPTQVEFNTSNMNFDVLDFSTSVNTCAYWQTTMPDKYTGGAVSATFYWTATSSSGTVTWGIKARSFNNDNPLDTAHSATTSVTDTLIATDDMHVSPATALFTPTGSPTGGSMVNFEVCRDVADTLGTNARLLSVSIEYPTEGLTD